MHISQHSLYSLFSSTVCAGHEENKHYALLDDTIIIYAKLLNLGPFYIIYSKLLYALSFKITLTRNRAEQKSSFYFIMQKIHFTIHFKRFFDYFDAITINKPHLNDLNEIKCHF